MTFKLSTVVTAVAACSAFAAPVHEHPRDHLEDIQCRCLTFRANEQPASCNFFESKGFSWRSAQAIASQYDIQIQFASKSTINKVLAISAPLPSEVLQAMDKGDAQSTTTDTNTSRNKIVCGFGKEVRHWTDHHYDHDPEGHFVGQVIAWLMLFIILYAAGERVWTRWSAQNRVIKLKGEEKPLKATNPSSTKASNYAPSNFT